MTATASTAKASKLSLTALALLKTRYVRVVSLLLASSSVLTDDAVSQARRIFLDHLARVDMTSGPVTAEIIQFHLVPDMKKQFNKFVKDHGCTYVVIVLSSFLCANAGRFQRYLP